MHQQLAYNEVFCDREQFPRTQERILRSILLRKLDELVPIEVLSVNIAATLNQFNKGDYTGTKALIEGPVLSFDQVKAAYSFREIGIYFPFLSSIKTSLAITTRKVLRPEYHIVSPTSSYAFALTPEPPDWRISLGAFSYLTVLDYLIKMSADGSRQVPSAELNSHLIAQKQAKMNMLNEVIPDPDWEQTPMFNPKKFGGFMHSLRQKLVEIGAPWSIPLITKGRDLGYRVEQVESLPIKEITYDI